MYKLSNLALTIWCYYYVDKVPLHITPTIARIKALYRIATLVALAAPAEEVEVEAEVEVRVEVLVAVVIVDEAEPPFHE